jgi:hypothetical protein
MAVSQQDSARRTFVRGGHVALATLGLVEGWQQLSSKTDVLGRARYADTTAPSQGILWVDGHYESHWAWVLWLFPAGRVP